MSRELVRTPPFSAPAVVPDRSRGMECRLSAVFRHGPNRGSPRPTKRSGCRSHPRKPGHGTWRSQTVPGRPGSSRCGFRAFTNHARIVGVRQAYPTPDVPDPGVGCAHPDDVSSHHWRVTAEHRYRLRERRPALARCPPDQRGHNPRWSGHPHRVDQGKQPDNGTVTGCGGGARATRVLAGRAGAMDRLDTAGRRSVGPARWREVTKRSLFAGKTLVGTGSQLLALVARPSGTALSAAS